MSTASTPIVPIGRATVTGNIYWKTQYWDPLTEDPTPAQASHSSAPIDPTQVNNNLGISAAIMGLVGHGPHPSPKIEKVATGTIISATKYSKPIGPHGTYEDPYCSASYEIDIFPFTQTDPLQFYISVAPKIGPFMAGVQAIPLSPQPRLAEGGNAQCDFQIQPL